jgi:hypothetical protein
VTTVANARAKVTDRAGINEGEGQGPPALAEKRRRSRDKVANMSGIILIVAIFSAGVLVGGIVGGVMGLASTLYEWRD